VKERQSRKMGVKTKKVFDSGRIKRGRNLGEINQGQGVEVKKKKRKKGCPELVKLTSSPYANGRAC
jgi:hypothetical protein